MNRNIMHIFRLYMFIGGMPQAIETYLEHKSINAFCDKYSSRIRDNYKL